MGNPGPAPAPRWTWLAPLLVGAATAVVAEVAVGILLYAGPGLMRSLTTVLGVEGAALAVGLWSAPAAGPGIVDQLRRRWVMCLVAFLGAALFGTSWSAVEDIGGGRLGQGIGLAVVAAFPLFASGNVLGAMASVAGTDPTGRLSGPGAAAALGAAMGFIATGVLLPRAPMPASLLVGCLVMLSLAGMTYGAVLNRRLQIHVRAFRPTRAGDVRVEDRRVAAAGYTTRVLMEGDHVRRAVRLEGEGAVPWDVAVVRATMPPEDRDWRVLLVGGGASLAPRAVLREHPSARVDVLERSGAVMELSREHLGTELVGDRQPVGPAPHPPARRLWVATGNLEDLLESVRGPYDLVLMDTAALAPVGGIASLSRRALAALARAAGEHTTLVLGPLPPEPGAVALLDGRQARVLRRTNGREEEVLLVSGGAGAAALPDTFEGFLATNGGPAPA